MDDILAEIFHVTETISNRRSALPSKSLPASLASQNLHSAHAVPAFESPRGIQDELMFQFAPLDHVTSHPVAKPQSSLYLQHSVADAHSLEHSQPQPLNDHQFHHTPGQSSDVAAKHAPPHSLSDVESPYAQSVITPWTRLPSSNISAPTAPDNPINLSNHHNNKFQRGAKRSFDDSMSPAPRSDKRCKAESQPLAAPVMQPTAKSILERRERAIREGRRREAKLSDSERRILRRLRNRESAERCRLRRVEQAAKLEDKIATIQQENDRLRLQATQYENQIKKLEAVISKSGNSRSSP